MRPSADAKQAIGRVCYLEATSVAPSADAKQAIGRACYLEATSVAPSLRLRRLSRVCVLAGDIRSSCVCVLTGDACLSTETQVAPSLRLTEVVACLRVLP